jgi:uncharacterized protein (DUF2147 family)
MNPQLQVFMRKGSFLAAFFLFCMHFSLQADNVTGFWQTMDKNTNQPSSVIAVYPYQGKYYGKIIATYNKEGVINDTIYHPVSRADGIAGNPYYCGLDIVYDAKLNSEGDRYEGYVVDPRKGKIYNAEIWNRNGNLILRGKLFIFGKNVTWPPFPTKNFTADFKKPDLATLVPNVLPPKNEN